MCVFQYFFLLQICAMARVRDAIAYLLERTGDIKGAFKIIQEVFIWSYVQ